MVLLRGLALSVLLHAAPAGADEACLTQQQFESLSTTTFQLPQGASLSRLGIEGLLLQRELAADQETYWLGFELYEPTLNLNGEDASSPVYGVPFAVRVEIASGKVREYLFNARLKRDDEEKLRAIYRTLHLARAPDGANPADFTVREVDSVGQYEVRYLRLPDGSRIKSRQRYTRIKPGVGNLKLSLAEISEDEFRFVEDSCWFTEVTGRSDIAVSGENLSVRTIQSLAINRRDGALPADARLPALPLNPLDWEPIPSSEIYPPPPRNPLASRDAFLAALAALDSSDMKALRQFLYDNEIYLDALGEQIRLGALEDTLERKLFLAIGQADSPAAHQLLTSLAIDPGLGENTRFRSLMALKYAKTPLAEGELEGLMAYARDPELAGKDAEIAHSAYKVLGIIARNQAGTEFGDALSARLMSELYATTSDDRAAALLTAVGNSGNGEMVGGVSDYLNNDSPKLRARAAQALAKLPGPEATENLARHLSREDDRLVTMATIDALGQRQLDSDSISKVMPYAARSQELEVRRTAVDALAGQVEQHPELKSELKQLMRGETDRKMLQTLMDAVY